MLVAGATQPTKGLRQKLTGLLRGAMEVVVLVLVVLSPWAFGCVHPLFERALFSGLALVLGLGALLLLLEGQSVRAACPVAGCLAGLALLGAWQITPLPPAALAWISPGTAVLNHQLLPAAPEILTGEEGRAADQTTAGSTISLYPSATRAILLKILAVVVLFVLVRDQIASPASARRLAIVALVNGFVLAFVGVLQFFSSPHDVLYWTFLSQGSVFGPFVCRNNFACYLNLCIGLGVGLLVVAGTKRERGPEGAAPHGGAAEPGRGGSSMLWIGAALAFMIAALALSLSRGAMLALIGAGAICAPVALGTSGRFAQLRTLLLTACLALGLVVWFGFDLVAARLSTVWKGHSLEESRVPLWNHSFPWVREFPWWGAGFGTFLYLEPVHRGPGAETAVFYDHAHNDYLELLLEGGVVGLALGLAAVVLVYRLGGRGFFRPGPWTTQGLALGGLLAFTTLVLHSFGDFGLHIPAVAVLATVLAAQLCGLGSSDRPTREIPDPPARPSLWVFSRLVTAAGVVAVGWILFAEGQRADEVERFRLAGKRYEGSRDLSGRTRQISYLRAATALAPDNAVLQLALADAYYETYRLEIAEAAIQADLATALRGLALRAVVVNGPAALVMSADLATTARVCRSCQHEETNRSRKETLIPALSHYRRARDLCPLLDRPHIRLAGEAGDRDLLVRADPPAAYLARARFLLPHDPQIWFLSGLEELEEGRQEEAWQSWRRSLICSRRYLGDILDRALGHLDGQAVVLRVMPEDSGLLYEAAALVAKRQEAAGLPFLEKALQLLEAQPTRLTPDALAMKAAIHQRLNQSPKALETYRELVARVPGQAAWRLELARLLYEHGRLQESRQELRVLLDEQPRNQAAKSLFEKVHEQIAAGNDDRAAPR